MNVQKALIVTAMTVGVAAGSYGIAAAANGTSTTTTPSTATAPGTPPAPNSSQPWGGQRGDETTLTGVALAKVTAIAESKVSGGTVVRVETDADGHAKYEAHMTDANGNPVTVYVDGDFNFVSVESRS